jgi:hypothetical protein
MTHSSPPRWQRIARFFAHSVRAALVATTTWSVLSGGGAGLPWGCTAYGEEINAKSAALLAAETITKDELKDFVDVLADDTFEGRETGTRGGHAAAAFLVKQLTELKLTPAGDRGSFYQAFQGHSRNVLGMMEGSDETLKNEVIILGAHYDHVGYGRPNNSFGPTGYIHNGADDNASGVAGVLEVIEALNHLPSRPRRTILFAFWDAEEAGLIGSRYWLSTPTIDLQRVKFKINADMIGRLRNNNLEVYGTRTAAGLRRLISEQNVHTGLNIDFTWKMKEDSDHWPFYARSIPTVMFHTGLHENYHRPSDDAHLINAEGIREVSRLITLTLLEIANADTVAPFREASKRETPEVQLQREQPARPSPPRIGVAWRMVENGPPVVTSITPGSPAEKAGIRPGDQILSYQGEPITDEHTFRLRLLAAEGEITFELRRAGVEAPLAISLVPNGRPIRVGLTWREDDGEPGTMIVSQVVPGSAADVGGLKVRDRIYRLNGETFATTEDFSRLLATAESPLTFVVERSGRLQSIKVEPLPRTQPQPQ